MNSAAGLGGVAELRRTFDEAFAGPAMRSTARVEPMIAIRVAGQAFAVRATEIAGVVKRSHVCPVPGRIPEFLGLAGVRGALVAVYDLAPLAGAVRRAGEPQWFAMPRGEPQLALAFDAIEGLFDAEPTSANAENATPAGAQPWRLAQIGTDMRTVMDIPAILRTIRAKAGLSAPAQE